MTMPVTLPLGEMIDMGGYRLHLRRSGPEKCRAGLPTAIIEAGCGFHSVMYSWLHERLAKQMKVVSYDRAGLGLSDESGKPRDANAMAEQLSNLIDRASIEGPLILIGHSIAGFYLRVFAKRFPNNIAGIVLLDSSHPGQSDLLSVSGFTVRYRMRQHMMAVYAKLGFVRILPPAWEARRAEYAGLSEAAKARLIAAFSLARNYTTPFIEMDAYAQSARQTLLAGDLGDLPLLVVTAPAAWPRSERGQKDRQVWLALQHDLARLSTRSKHLIFEEAGHCTLVTEQRHAQPVVEAIIDFTASLKVPESHR